MAIFWAICQWVGFASLIFTVVVVGYGLLLNAFTKDVAEYREF